MTDIERQITTRLDTIRTDARRAREEFDREQATIVHDRMRSNLAKELDVREAAKRANARIDSARTEEQAFVTATKDKIITSLFGMTAPSSQQIVEHRDATDRAMAIDSGDEDKAIELYERAYRSSDKTMMAALAARAYDLGHDRVLDLHGERTPGTQGEIDSLRFLDQMENDARALVASAFAFSKVGKSNW